MDGLIHVNGVKNKKTLYLSPLFWFFDLFLFFFGGGGVWDFFTLSGNNEKKILIVDTYKRCIYARNQFPILCVNIMSKVSGVEHGMQH
jgi:hypothetical protein